MSSGTVIGIDVAASRPSTAVLIGQGAVLGWLDTDDIPQLVSWVLENRPDVVAIDAPCGMSRGLLRTPGKGKPYNGRVCDRELRLRGIPVYEVPSSREDAPGWMKVGFRLYDALKEAGYQHPTEPGVRPSVIEVYPHASFVTLLGETPAKKSTSRGREQRIEVLARYGLRDLDRTDHDALDALAAALTGLRFLDGRACALGDPGEALLWLPVVQLMERYSPASKKAARLELAELEHLHRTLSFEQRDELLECLLVAASRGGEAMVGVLGQLLLCYATEEVLEQLEG